MVGWSIRWLPFGTEHARPSAPVTQQHTTRSRGLQNYNMFAQAASASVSMRRFPTSHTLGLQSYLRNEGMTGPEHGTHPSPTFETKVRLELPLSL